MRTNGSNYSTRTRLHNLLVLHLNINFIYMYFSCNIKAKYHLTIRSKMRAEPLQLQMAGCSLSTFGRVSDDARVQTWSSPSSCSCAAGSGARPGAADRSDACDGQSCVKTSYHRSTTKNCHVTINYVHV